MGLEDPPPKVYADSSTPGMVIEGTPLPKEEPPFQIGQGLGPFTPTLLGGTPVNNNGASESDPTVVTIERIFVKGKNLPADKPKKPVPSVLQQPLGSLFDYTALNRILYQYGQAHRGDLDDEIAFADALNKYAFGVSVAVALPVAVPLLANSPQFIASASYATYVTYMNYAPEINSFATNFVDGILPSAPSNVPENIPQALGGLFSPGP